jgi:hypothetical protein
MADVYVATEDFAAEYDGKPLTVVKGVTRVRAGHPMLKVYGAYFTPADTKVHYDVEQTTAAPGEKRGA